MAKLNANPSVLESVAGKLEGIAADMNSERRKLDNTGSKAAAAWKSRYTQEYLFNVNVVGAKIGNTAGSIGSVASQLRRIAAEVRRLERELARKNAGR